MYQGMKELRVGRANGTELAVLPMLQGFGRDRPRAASAAWRLTAVSAAWRRCRPEGLRPTQPGGRP